MLRSNGVQHPIWFNALLLLDAFTLGGLLAMRLVLQLLESIMDRLIKGEAQKESQHDTD